jgi:hypothetical protein
MHEMLFQEPVDQVEDFQKFILVEPGYESLQKFIIGEFLQIKNYGVFIGIPIGPDAHHAFVGLNKIV